MPKISQLFLVFTLLVTGAHLSALEYKEVIGSYGADYDATIALIKAKITPENEKQMQAALKDMEQQRDKFQFVTFTFNAKTVEFLMDDGTSVDKKVNEITASTPAADGSIEIIVQEVQNPSAQRSAHEMTMKLSRHAEALVLEAEGITFSLTKK